MSAAFLAATRKGLFTIQNANGSRWEVTTASFIGDHVPIVMTDPRDGSLYAALEHGHFGTKMHRSTDRGATWTEIGVPVYPEAKPGEESLDHWGKPIPWKLAKIWALAAGNADQPGVLWCGTLPGGLFRSSDHGASWQLIETLWRHPKRPEWFGGGADLPGIHSICVHPDNGNDVAVGVSCGGVWRTTDGGETWNCRANGMRAAYMPPEQQFEPNIQDPHCLVQCPTQPDHMWVQHHNGIFRSTDRAASWSEIENVDPSSFGFPVAVHPKDPNTAWFVPAIKDEKRVPVGGQVVVTHTRDGGKTFKVLRNGLPQQHAYDLVFRHALDIDPSGTSLAFGSTTGSLWATTDQGRSWQTVSNHLPPVYCVRYLPS